MPRSGMKTTTFFPFLLRVKDAFVPVSRSTSFLICGSSERIPAMLYTDIPATARIRTGKTACPRGLNLLVGAESLAKYTEGSEQREGAGK